MNRDDTPPHWTAAPLGDIADVQLGKMLDRKRTAGTPVRYLRNINIRWDYVDTSDLLEMPFKEKELETYSLRAGDVLVCEGGEPGRAAVWSVDDSTIKFQKALHRVRLKGGIVPRWLVFQLYFDAQSGSLAKRFTGTTIKHLPQEAIREYSVKLPPRPEQHRIVEAIESYFTRLDDAVATLERVQRNLKRYRASVLKAAVEGRLVPTEAELARAENRDYEPASVLLDRILTERRRRWEEAALAKMKAMGKIPKDGKWKKKYKEPEGPNTSELPALPEGWCWASVAQLAFIASGQTPQGVTSAGKSSGDIPWFRVGDMNAEGNETQMTAATEWLTFDQVRSLGLHVQPPGTFIFPKRGGAINTNKKRLLVMPSAYDLNTMGLVPVGDVAGYLWRWFLGIDLGELADGSNVPQINHGDVEPLAVPVPPLFEQRRIIDSVDSALSVIAESTSTAAFNLVRLSRLRQSILKWAFEGRLVDQDPTDEPASALLECIAVERTNSKTQETSPRRKRRSSRA